MLRTLFDLNLLANMVAKLANIVREHVKFDKIANNVGQFGHTLRSYSGFKRMIFPIELLNVSL